MPAVLVGEDAVAVSLAAFLETFVFAADEVLFGDVLGLGVAEDGLVLVVDLDDGGVEAAGGEGRFLFEGDDVVDVVEVVGFGVGLGGLEEGVDVGQGGGGLGVGVGGFDCVALGLDCGDVLVLEL